MSRWLLNTSKKRDSTTSLGPYMSVMIKRRSFWCINDIFPISVCAHCLSFFHWKPVSYLQRSRRAKASPVPGFLFESLQGTMSRVSPAHGPQAASLGCLHQCPSYSTLHFHLLLIRKKKANIKLPLHISIPFPSLLPHPVAWIIPARCLFPPTPTTFISVQSLLLY